MYKAKNKKILSNEGMTNAGVLFFAKEPYKHLGNSRLRCVRFKGNKRIDIIDKKEVDKGIIGNIEFAIKYLNECIPVRFEIIGSKRKEYPQFLEESYREAIVNSVAHRDYFENGEIAVEKLKDNLIINNPGSSLVPKKEFGTVSRLRNRLIADLLSRTVFMERVGTGIKRIKDSCLKNNNDVEFEFSSKNFFVTIKSEPVNEEINKPVSEPVNERRKKAIEYVYRCKKITPREYREINKVSKETAWKDINELLRRNILIKKSSGAHTSYALKPNDKKETKKKKISNPK